MKEKNFTKMLVGEKATFRDSRNSTLTGEVIGETKNTFKVRTGRGDKILMKKNYSLVLGNKTISGASMMKRPEDRIKG